MIKILTVIGARPQIIKAAALSRAIRTHFPTQLKEIIVHTGQHYDQNMSQVFFDELEIPTPDYNLQVGSASHGQMTATMIVKLEEVLLIEQPRFCILYGDTNSTLAGAVAASKLKIPVIHIEAGLRSFNKSMPEEINRIMCDHVSTFLFTPTENGFHNLCREGFDPNAKPPYTIDRPAIFHCGDVMYDNSIYFAQKAKQTSTILTTLNIKEGAFILATIHRDHNTDNSERLTSIFTALAKIATQQKVVLPLHPRTAKMLKQMLPEHLYNSIQQELNIIITAPVSFLDMIQLEANANMIMTDSGGVQKEAFFFKKPCLIVRPETEWVELVALGAAKLVDADVNSIILAHANFTENKTEQWPQLFGDGHAAEFICNTIIKQS